MEELDLLAVIEDAGGDVSALNLITSLLLSSPLLSSPLLSSPLQVSLGRILEHLCQIFKAPTP